MPHPVRLLRDSAALAAVACAVGGWLGPTGLAFGVGAAAFVVNVLLLLVSVGHGGPWVWVRLGAKVPAAAAALLFLAHWFDALPLVLGYGGTLIVTSLVTVLRSKASPELA